MAERRFDPVSLVLGLVFAVAGLIATTGGSIVDDGAWLLPVALIGLGIGLLLQMRSASQAAGQAGQAGERGEAPH